MKKQLLTALAVAAAATVSYGQGIIFVDDSGNTGVFGGAGGPSSDPVYSSSVTANGLIFTLDSNDQEGQTGGTAGSQLIGADFSFALYAAATPSALAADIAAGTPLDSATGANISGVNAVYGGLTDPSGNFFTIPGVTAGSTAYLDLQVWEGNTFTTYAAALAGKDYAGDTGTFSNPTGGAGSPPGPAAYLTGQPDLLLTVPEPTTMALAALGGAAMLFIRRKK